MAGIVAGNAGAFIVGSNFEPPDRVLKRAVLDAVYFAGERKRATYLQYFEANATFLVADREGKVLATHKIYEDLTDEIRENEDLMPKTTFRAIGPLSGPDGDERNMMRIIWNLLGYIFMRVAVFPFIRRLIFGARQSK